MSINNGLLELEKAEKKIALMRELGTRDGFFSYYFSKLKLHPSNIACFKEVNELYNSLFGEYRYSDYRSFKTSYSHFLKNKKNK